MPIQQMFLGAGGPAPAQPLGNIPVTSNLLWYYDGYYVTESGGQLTQWTDQSGNGRHQSVSGGITVPSSVFGAGDAVTIINDSSSAQTITKGSGLNMFNSADATNANRTLGGRGMATIYFVNSSTSYISGAGLS